MLPKNLWNRESIDKCNKELTLSNNCNLIRSSRIIVQLKTEYDVLIGNQFLIRHCKVIRNPR